MKKKDFNLMMKILREIEESIDYSELWSLREYCLICLFKEFYNEKLAKNKRITYCGFTIWITKRLRKK